MSIVVGAASRVSFSREPGFSTLAALLEREGPQMTTIEERVSRLEGGYEHLATKADLANLKAELNDKLNSLEARLTRLFLGALIAVASLAVAAATYLQSIT